MRVSPPVLASATFTSPLTGVETLELLLAALPSPVVKTNARLLIAGTANAFGVTVSVTVACAPTASGTVRTQRTNAAAKVQVKFGPVALTKVSGVASESRTRIVSVVAPLPTFCTESV